VAEIYAWHDRAACLDTEVDFFPENGNVRPALAVCSECPVINECRTHALSEREEFGVWGGTTAAERRRIWTITP
jgi:WhiB family transcriptional regulator, redox-sensing transcriptional regulator